MEPIVFQNAHNLSLPVDQIELVKKTIAYEQAALAKNTRRTYATRWAKFEEWCQKNKLTSLPASAETISLYLSDLGGGVSFSTIGCTISAIEKIHKQRGLRIIGDPELYKRVKKGIRREHKDKQSLKQAKALTVLELSLFCRQLGAGLRNLRDKAMVTVAFFGALRRSELVALDREHVEFNDKGMILHLLQTKTSDEVVRIYLTKTRESSICPVLSLKTWLEKAAIIEGPVFRSLSKGERLATKRLSDRSVADIMKQYFGQEYSGHSLRRGLVTAVAEKGTPIHKIQQHSRHKSADMVMRYVERIEGFENSSTNTLGI